MRLIYFLFILLAGSSSFAESLSTSLEIKQIDEYLFVHTSYKEVEGYGVVNSNGLIVLDGIQAFLIDTPWSTSDTEKLLAWLDGQGYELLASISTHSHEDRTAGIDLLNARLIPTYTSKLTNELLLHDGRPTATNTFDQIDFSLGNGRIEVFYPGPGHTVDNLVVWLPEENILFGGCLVRSLEWSSLGYIGEASLNTWADSIRKIVNKYPDITSIVPGHGEIGNTQILDHTIRLAEDAAK
tara:strand:+ start:680 stop:1399 length:720 start_codon:yes stop_codon:yes gene_type:complete